MRLRAEFLDGVVVDSGMITADRYTGTFGPYRVDIHSPKAGHVAGWLESKLEPILPGGDQTVPRPVIQALGLSAPPGWLPYEGDLQGVRPWLAGPGGSQVNVDGEDCWVAINPGDKLPRHSQFPAGGYPLQGGTRLRFDFCAPGVKPWPDPRPEHAQIINQFLAWHGYTDILDPQDTIASMPSALVELVRFWTAGKGGGYSLQDWIKRRFDSRVETTGIHALGRIPWADIDCNRHYSMGAWPILAWWLFQDPDAWKMAFRLFRAHLQHGIYTGPGRYSYWHASEKAGGEMEYLGDDSVPTREHGCDDWLVFMAQLTQDPMALEIMRGRAKMLREAPVEYHWNGGGGSRILGRALFNLRAHHVLGGEDMAAPMTAVLQHAYRLDAEAGKPWISDSYFPDAVSPWLDAFTLAEVYETCKLLGLPTLWAETKARWHLDNAVEIIATGDARIPHEITSWSTRQYKWLYGDVAAAFMLPVADFMARIDPSYIPKRDACRKTAISKIIISEIAAIGGGGGWAKKCAEIMSTAGKPKVWTA
jgi:hypothetical protein